MERDPEAFAAFLKRNIFDCVDNEAYIAANGGARKMRELRAKELLLYREEN